MLFPSEAESRWVDKEKELERKLEEIRKLCPQKCDHCDEMLSLLRAHFASHGKEERASEEESEPIAMRDEQPRPEPVTPFEPPPRKVLRSRTEKVVDTAIESKAVPKEETAASVTVGPTVAAKTRRTTRSAAATESTSGAATSPKVDVSDRKKAKEVVIKKDALERVQSPNPVKVEPVSSPSSMPPVTSDSPPVKKKAVTKAKQAHSGPTPFVESLGKDVPSHVSAHLTPPLVSWSLLTH